jgi:hypothetical protein
MRQALQIFRKDVRLLWLPILLVLMLTTAFAWSESEVQGTDVGIEGAGFVAVRMSGVIDFLLVVGWFYLVSAAIYQESPTGDRQFWITRPYFWKSLWAAKALLIFAFINVPFFLSDLAILFAQNVPATAGALLRRQVVLTGVLLLPTAALAAVTRHYAQIVLTVFAGLLMLVFTAQYLNSANASWGRLEWIPASVFVALLLLSGVGVLGWQYRSRRTWAGRGVLIAAAVLCLGTFAIPPFGLALVLASPFSDPPDLQGVHIARMVSDGADVPDWSPVRVDGLPPGMRAEPELMSLTIETARGESWNSRWHPVAHDLSYIVWEGGEGDQVNISDRAPADKRFRFQPVNIRLAVVMSVFRTDTAIPVVPDGSPVEIPGVGDCSVTTLGGLGTSSFSCRAARYPLKRVRINGTTVVGEPAGYGALLDLSPIFRNSQGIGIGNRSETPDESFSFTTEQPLVYLRRDLVLTHVRLGAKKQ